MNILLREGFWLGVAALVALLGAPITMATAVEMQVACLAAGAAPALDCAATAAVGAAPVALITVGVAGGALYAWDRLRNLLRAS